VEKKQESKQYETVKIAEKQCKFYITRAKAGSLAV